MSESLLSEWLIHGQMLCSLHLIIHLKVGVYMAGAFDRTAVDGLLPTRSFAGEIGPNASML